MTAITSIKVNALSFGKAEASVYLAKRLPHFNEWDRDFFNSEAFLALSEAMNDYDGTTGYSVVSFLRGRVQARLNNAVRKEIKSVGISPVMVRDGMKQTESKLDFEKVMDCLDSRDRKIFYLYFIEDKTLEAVGKIIGVSRERVRQLLKGRIRKKVIEVLNDR